MTLQVVRSWNPVYCAPRSRDGGLLGNLGCVVNRRLWPGDECGAVVVNRKAAGLLVGCGLDAYPVRPVGFLGPGISLAVYETTRAHGSCRPYSAHWRHFSGFVGCASIVVAVNFRTGECGAFGGYATASGLNVAPMASPLYVTLGPLRPQVLLPPWHTASPADVADPLWWQKVGDWHQDNGDPFADVCYQAAGYLGTIIGLTEKV